MLLVCFNVVCLYLCLCMNLCFAHLTYQRVCDVGPVNAVLQLQLVMGLDVEQQVLIETHSSDQVCAVGTLQSAATVDVLQWRREKENTTT